MRWKDQGFGVKLGIGFGALLVLVVIIGTWTVVGVNAILSDAHQAIMSNRMDGQLAQMELDHLSWIKKVNLLLTNQAGASQEISADDQACTTGRWLSGSGRAEAQTLVPTLEPTLRTLEKSHRELHESVKTIVRVFRRADEALPATLLAGEIDLLDWSGKIRETFIKFRSALEVTTDPTQDAIGKWLNSKEARRVYADASPGVQKAWDGLQKAHAQLFQSAAEIADNMQAGQQDPSKYLEARKIFETQTLNMLQGTLAALRSLKKAAEQDLAGVISARQIYAQQTEPALTRVQEQFGALRTKIKQHLRGDEQLLNTAGATRSAVIVLAIAAVAGGIVLAVVISLGIVRPLRTGAAFAHAMAGGNLKARLDLDQKDEIGNLAQALNTMADNLGTMLADISRGVVTLSSSSTELSAISREMSQGADQAAGQTNALAAASEQVSANITTVASASEETATNIGIISAASEEMTATINEIAKNTESARNIATEAVVHAQKASEQVAELGQSAQQIGKVLETITDISEQVNLLALNATIEAARAGEAGKGFAVVANEIKELANQTAAASANIKQQIGDIRSSIQVTVGGIGSIGSVVANMNDIVGGIATAIEEQSATTHEIAGNVAQAAEGIKEVNANIAQSSTAVTSIASEIAHIGRATDAIAGNSARVDQSATQLTRFSDQLKQMVGRFSI
jgi:methyl-accepting chemotaxis protein